jgi:hypothetical protein
MRHGRRTLMRQSQGKLTMNEIRVRDVAEKLSWQNPEKVKSIIRHLALWATSNAAEDIEEAAEIYSAEAGQVEVIARAFPRETVWDAVTGWEAAYRRAAEAIISSINSDPCCGFEYCEHYDSTTETDGIEIRPAPVDISKIMGREDAVALGAIQSLDVKEVIDKLSADERRPKFEVWSFDYRIDDETEEPYFSLAGVIDGSPFTISVHASEPFENAGWVDFEDPEFFSQFMFCGSWSKLSDDERRRAIKALTQATEPSGDRWTPEMVHQMLANPFYCGLIVDPAFTLERPIEEGYIQTAVQMIHDVGIGVFLSNFLARLKDPSHPLPIGTTVPEDRLLARVEVHPHFAMDREPLISEEKFIAAAIVHAAESGAENYMRELLENLKGNWVS